MPIKYEIMIDARAVPWAAATVTRYGAYDKRAYDKKELRWLIKLAWDKEMITNPVEIGFYFAFKPPKSASKSKSNAMVAGNIKHTVKPDATNCQKLVEDCLKGIVIQDDNQVFKISTEKYYAESDHIKIVIIEHGV